MGKRKSPVVAAVSAPKSPKKAKSQAKVNKSEAGENVALFIL